MKWTKNIFICQCTHVGGLINQKTALSSTNHWAEALKRFCITVGGVAAAVSVFVQLNQFSQILSRQCCVGLWRGNMVRNLLTFGHWEVVFSLFLILYRAFSHFMYPTFCQFRKRKMVQSWFQKVFWNKDCDVFGNLVVEIKNFNFCLFVCLFVCLYLTFCQFRKWKMV